MLPNASHDVPAPVYQMGLWYHTGSSNESMRAIACYRDQKRRLANLAAGGPTARHRGSTRSTTPPGPAGATAIGIGFSMMSTGTAAVDGLAIGDLSVPPPFAPPGG
jgi:hypothetical protein